MRPIPFRLGLRLLAAVGLVALTAASSLAQTAESPDPVETDGRYQLFIRKNAHGQDYWTIFDTRTGAAKVFEGQTIRLISYEQERNVLLTTGTKPDN